MSIKKILLITVIVVVVFLLAGLLYVKIGARKNINIKSAINYYTQTSSNPYYVEGNSLIGQAKYEEAIAAFKTGMASSSSTGEKSVFDIAIATTEMNLDKKKGVEDLVNVGNTTNYPSISRAYALQYAYQQYLGYRDPNLLRPFLTEEEFKSIDFSKKLPNEVVRKIHEKIYALAPLPLTRARLAYVAWQEGGLKAQGEVNKKMKDFELSVKDTENFTGMSILLPPAYYVAALLTADMKKSGATLTFGQPEHFFEETITRSQIAHVDSTYQFGLLAYANYLVRMKEFDKALLLLQQLSAKQINPMITANLQQESIVTAQYTELVASAKTNVMIKTELEKIGFVIK